MNFVTGGTGLVGVRLIYDLINKGEEVMAMRREHTPAEKFSRLIRFYTPDIKGMEAHITWVEGDLMDLETLIQIIPEGSRVYHCAARVSFNPKKSQEIIETNVEGTANLVTACLAKKVTKLCHVSSIGALGGKINGQKITEETPWSPSGKSAYSLSKYFSELEIWRGIAEGLNAVIVNPSVILGAGDWKQGSPQLFSLAYNGSKYYTQGSTSYVDVCDVTRAMILLMESDIHSERFLLASETLTYKDLFALIASAIQVKGPQRYAGKWLTAVAYRLEWLRSTMLGKEPQMTKQTHKIAHTCDSYSGLKITERLAFSYTAIQETIKGIGSAFRDSHLKET